MTESNVNVQGCSRFRFEDLDEATSAFCAANVIGEGGFGKVYKGSLRDGTLIAVKCLDPLSQQGDHEYYAEIALLSRLRHPNLVCMMGMCTERGQKLGVYEYMARGSLRDLLDKKHLVWRERMDIALGIARGLCYLHEISQPPVIHCDFKSANVLVDTFGQAHVADFGLARYIGGARPVSAAGGAPSGPPSDITIVTSIRGTFGYLSPEYLEQGQASVRADVFAFGVVLLELMTGQEAVDVSRPRGQQLLADWMRPQLRDPGWVLQVLDRAISAQAMAVQVAVLSEVAEACVRTNPRERPSMLDVVRAVTAAQQFIEELSVQRQQLAAQASQRTATQAQQAAATALQAAQAAAAQAQAQALAEHAAARQQQQQLQQQTAAAHAQAAALQAAQAAAARAAAAQAQALAEHAAARQQLQQQEQQQQQRGGGGSALQMGAQGVGGRAGEDADRAMVAEVCEFMRSFRLGQEPLSAHPPLPSRLGEGGGAGGGSGGSPGPGALLPPVGASRFPMAQPPRAQHGQAAAIGRAGSGPDGAASGGASASQPQAARRSLGSDMSAAVPGGGPGQGAPSRAGAAAQQRQAPNMPAISMFGQLK